MISEKVPILASLVLSKERELNVRSESLKNSTIQVVDSSTKLQSSRISQQADHSKTAWYTSATPAVFYYAIAASFSAILAGCTLSFPSSAVLDLTDSEARKEYKFDEQLSDIFGVSFT